MKKNTNILCFVAILTFLMLGFQNCADDGAQGPAGEQGVAGSSCTVSEVIGGALITCEDGSEQFVANGQDFVPTLPENFAGVFELENGSILEIEVVSEVEVVFREHELISVNFDGGLATHPDLPIGPHRVLSGRVNGVYSPDYDERDNDVEVDFEESTNINGRRDTLFEVFFANDGKLRVRLVVFDREEIIVDRTLKEI